MWARRTMQRRSNVSQLVSLGMSNTCVRFVTASDMENFRSASKCLNEKRRRCNDNGRGASLSLRRFEHYQLSLPLQRYSTFFSSSLWALVSTSGSHRSCQNSPKQQRMSNKAVPFHSSTQAFSTINKSYDEASYDVVIVGGGVVGATLAKLLLNADVGSNRSGVGAASSSSIPRAAPKMKIAVLDVKRPDPLSSFALDASRNAASSTENATFSHINFPSPRSYAISPASLISLGSCGGIRKNIDDQASSGAKKHDKDDVVATLHKMGRVSYYDKMQIWESNGPGTLRFHGSDLSFHPNKSIATQKILGAIIEDGPLVSTLWDVLEATHKDDGSIDLFAPARVTMIRSPSSKPTKVELTNKELDYGRVAISFQDEGLQERTVKTKLLVAADGANSFVRKMLGMPTLSMGYGRKAVTTTVRIKPNQSMNKTAYQRFFPNGPLALLPMWDGTYANIVWSTTPDKVDRLLSLSREEFVHELNESLQAGPTTPPLLLKNKGEYLASYPFALNVVYGVDMLARAAGEGLAMSRWNDDPFQIPPQVGEVLGKRFAFDLSLCQARQYVQPRVALVGDAAHTVHPMAGQGLNLGIADAQCLAEYILSAKQAGMDPGESYFLAQYQRERQAAVATMQGGIHAIHAAFGAEATPLLWLRSIGVNMINMTTPLRRKLAEVAAGNIV